MAIPALVKNLDDVREALRSEYAKGDGSDARPDAEQYYLDVTPSDGWALENTSGLLKTVSKLRGEVRTLKQEAKAWEGLSPDDARDALESRDAGAQTATEAMQKKLENQRKQLVDAHESEKSGLRKEIAELEEAINVALIDSTATAALNGKGSVELLLPIVRRSAKVVKLDSGHRVTRYYDGEGNEMLSRRPGANGAPMETPEFLETLRVNAAFAPAFTGSGPAGGGTPGKGEGRSEPGTGHAKIDPALPPGERLKRFRAQQRAGEG